ncbi:MAG: hypothetical protein AAFX81_21245, partial [Pseudomonadota bacterium]
MGTQNLDIDGQGNVAVQIQGDGNSVTITVGDTSLVLTKRHELRFEPEAPLDLLLPENEVVPLVGRDDVRADLDAWLADDAPISVRLVTGEGGSGKTRLAIDLCRGAEAGGWTAGFAATEEMARFHGQTNVEAWRPDKPVLVVVDYAATKGPVLQRWLTGLARMRSLPEAGKLRLLLLERHGSRDGGWWQALTQFGGIEARRLQRMIDPPEPIGLMPIAAADDRRRVLAAVMAAASALDGREPPLAPPEPGADPWFDRRLADPSADNSPLLLHMAALAAVQARQAHKLDRSRTELALELADQEILRLRKLAENRGVGPALFQHLVAAVTVEGGVDGEGLQRLLTEEGAALNAPMSIDDVHARRNALLAALTPPERHGAAPAAAKLVDAVRPDLVGEALVLRTWEPEPDQFARVDRCWVRAPAATAEALVRLGQDFGTPTAAHAPDPTPIRWLDHCIDRVDDLAGLQTLADAMPQATVNLRVQAERALSRLIEVLESATEPDGLRIVLTRGNRALRLNGLGRPDLARADELRVRDAARELARHDADAFA